jgi:plastocyanin
MKNGRFAALALAAAAMPLASGMAAAPRQHVVVIDKMKFGPLPTSIHVGDTILWVNHDLFQHSATARDGSFDIDLPAGKSGKTVMKRAGAIAFACKYHPGMTGVIKVAQ